MPNAVSDAARKHFITPALAKEMTGKFRGMKEKILRQEFAGKDMLPLSETFDKTAIQALLDQPGCVKFRTYLGMDENMEIRIIFVGVNEKDQDMVDNSVTGEAVILEEGSRCPPDCPTPPPPLAT